MHYLLFIYLRLSVKWNKNGKGTKLKDLAELALRAKRAGKAGGQGRARGFWISVG